MSDTTPERKLLTEAQVDNLGHAILTLTRELWVLTDRLHTVEAVLEKQGLSVKESVESYVPSAEEKAQRIEHSQRILNSVLGALGIGISPGAQMAEQSLKNASDN